MASSAALARMTYVSSASDRYFTEFETLVRKGLFNEASFLVREDGSHMSDLPSPVEIPNPVLPQNRIHASSTLSLIQGSDDEPAILAAVSGTAPRTRASVFCKTIIVFPKNPTDTLIHAIFGAADRFLENPKSQYSSRNHFHGNLVDSLLKSISDLAKSETPFDPTRAAKQLSTLSLDMESIVDAMDSHTVSKPQSAIVLHPETLSVIIPMLESMALARDSSEAPSQGRGPSI